jgi:hypothetical protein
VTKSTGIITTVAGEGNGGYGTDKYSGDGGLVTSVELGCIRRVAIDAPGNI